MPRLKLLSARELMKALERMGFQRTRQKGSHVRFAHADGRKTSVPVHAGEDLGPGLLNKIIKRDLKMTREEFEKCW